MDQPHYSQGKCLYLLGWWESSLWPTQLSYGALSLWWENPLGTGESILWAPRATSFFHCVPGSLGLCGVNVGERSRYTNVFSVDSADFFKKLSSYLYLVCHDGEKGREMPFPGGKVFCPFYAPVYSVVAAAWLFSHCWACWSHSWYLTASVDTTSVILLSHLPYSFQYATFRHPGTWIF